MISIVQISKKSGGLNMNEELNEFFEFYVPSSPAEPEEDAEFTEAYFGRLPELEQISRLFEQLIKKVRSVGVDKSNPNKYKETRDIEKLFAKVFGLKKVYFYWMPDPGANAFTLTFYSIMIGGESKKYLEVDAKKGYYDSSHKSTFTVYGYVDILDGSITGDELTGILLHEFGHNFDYSVYHKVEYIRDALYGLTAKQYGGSIEDLNELKMDYYYQRQHQGDKVYKDQKKRNDTRKRYNKALGIYYNTNTLTEVIRTLYLQLMNFGYVALFPFTFILTMQDLGAKKGEQFADSFATAYGYGPDMINALNKMSKVPPNIKVEKRNPVHRMLKHFNELQLEIFNAMTEVHGTHAERCNDCIKKVKSDIVNNDFPPELRDDLYKELKRLEDQYQEYLTCSPEQKNRILVLWRRILDKFGGSFNFAALFKRNQA